MLPGWDDNVFGIRGNSVSYRARPVDVEFGHGRAGASRRRAFWNDFVSGFGLAGGAGQCSEDRCCGPQADGGHRGSGRSGGYYQISDTE